MYGYGNRSKNTHFTNSLGPIRRQERSLNTKSTESARNWQFQQPNPTIFQPLGAVEKRGKEVWRKKGIAETSKQGEVRNNGTKDQEKSSSIESISIQPSGSGWLFRSEVAKMRRLESIQTLTDIFNREKVENFQIKSMGGRFLIISFLDAKVRDDVINGKWLD